MYVCVCVCLNSTPALGDDVQNISAHTWTCRPHCKLCYRQELSPASPTHCSHILQIIPPFLINTMQLRPSNWLHKYPNQVYHQCVDIKHWCFQSKMWLNFCGSTGIAILFRLPLSAGKWRISSDNYRVLQQYLHDACFSPFCYQADDSF